MEEYGIKQNNVTVENRESVRVSGVISVINFDENEVLLETSSGELYVRGRGLHVESLSLETGDVAFKGTVDSLEYRGKQKEGSFWSKLF